MVEDLVRSLLPRIDYEHEHRFTEHEYEHEEDKQPEPRNAPKIKVRRASSVISNDLACNLRALRFGLEHRVFAFEERFCGS